MMDVPAFISFTQSSPFSHCCILCVIGADFCTKFPPDCGEILKKEKDFNHSSSCKLYLKSGEKLIQEGDCNDYENTGWMWMIQKTVRLTSEPLVHVLLRQQEEEHCNTASSFRLCISSAFLGFFWEAFINKMGLKVPQTPQRNLAGCSCRVP